MAVTIAENRLLAVLFVGSVNYDVLANRTRELLFLSLAVSHFKVRETQEVRKSGYNKLRKRSIVLFECSFWLFSSAILFGCCRSPYQGSFVE